MISSICKGYTVIIVGYLNLYSTNSIIFLFEASKLRFVDNGILR